MKQHQKLTVVLCLIWVVNLLYGEMFAFWVSSLWSCSWPHHRLKMDDLEYTGDYVKVAVLADPQLMDKTSLPLAPKSLALEIAQFYTDINMRRAFFSSIMPFKPDVILFLGDYFDGGLYLSDEEWQDSLSRFRHIFGLNAQGRFSDIPVHYIPGNHDIGYSSLHSQKPEVVKRYENEFGIRNYRFTVGNVEFIAVDAQTIDGHPQNNLTSATWDFVKNVSQEVQSNPRVLLTHIPLYREDQTHCGPHRGSSVINQRIWRTVDGREINYQNYITEESSIKLLDLIKPVLILSGHDHDQCTMTHKSKAGPVKEQTLGTISWQQGNLYPSFMLLSVSNPALPNTFGPEKAVFTHLCFLPVQLHIYLWYLSLFVLTLVALLFWPKSGLRFLPHLSDLVECGRKLMSGTKEKNEDENCEYEMIWDAEGSMHLVKRPVEKPATLASNRGPVERGNAVMRPTARKNITEDVEVHMDVDMNAEAGLKLLPRTSNSKMKLIIQRLVRTLWMVIAVAALNVPLYMMLLFKDWIDQ